MTSLPDITSVLSRYDRLCGQRQVSESTIRQLESSVLSLEKRVSEGEMITALFRTMMDSEISDTITQVDQLLTEGMSVVFPDQDLSVTSEVSTFRGKVGISTTTRSKYKDGSVIEGKSGDAFGGAINTVQSVLLRVFVILKRGLRPVIVMDETLAAIEGEYIVQMASFLSTLSERFGFDILLITHDPRLVDCSDHAYRIVNKNGKATYKKLK